MNFCLSIRQPNHYLEQADEIIADYKDYQAIYDKIELYPDKKYIIKIPKGIEVNYDDIAALASQGRIILALSEMTQEVITACRARNLKYYWGYPITSWYEYRALIDLGVSELLLGAPLYFELRSIKTNLPIRLVANVCYDSYLPRINGICGTYVRPEDVTLYEKVGVKTLEFVTDNLTKEWTMFKIYAQDKNWPGNLNFLLTNFNCQVDNRIIPADFAEVRVNCGQKCQKNGICHFCERVMNYTYMLQKTKDDWIPGVGFNEQS